MVCTDLSKRRASGKMSFHKMMYNQRQIPDSASPLFPNVDHGPLEICNGGRSTLFNAECLGLDSSESATNLLLSGSFAAAVYKLQDRRRHLLGSDKRASLASAVSRRHFQKKKDWTDTVTQCKRERGCCRFTRQGSAEHGPTELIALR